MNILPSRNSGEELYESDKVARNNLRFTLPSLFERSNPVAVGSLVNIS